MDKIGYRSKKTGDRNFRLGKYKFVIWTIFATVFIVGYIIAVLNTVPHSAWEPRAKNTLRSHAETQVAYSNQHENRFFGTFEDLQDTDYIAKGYTKENIIENYILWTSVSNYSSLGESGNVSYNRALNTFTAVAFPKEPNNKGYLKTYAIREDMILRFYNPRRRDTKAWGEEGDYGCRTWEPIR